MSDVPPLELMQTRRHSTLRDRRGRVKNATKCEQFIPSLLMCHVNNTPRFTFSTYFLAAALSSLIVVSH